MEISIPTNNTQFGEDQLRQFAESLMKEAGVWDIDLGIREGFVQNLMLEAQKRIGLVAMEALDDQGMEAYALFMDKEEIPPPDAVMAFFTSNIPNLSEVIMNGLKKFADEYLAGVKKG